MSARHAVLCFLGLLCLPAALLAAPNGVGLTGAGQPKPGGGGGSPDAPPRPPAITALAVAPDVPLVLVGAADGSLRRGSLGNSDLPLAPPEPVGKLPGAVIGLAVGPGGLTVAVSDAGHLALLGPTDAAPRLLGRHEAGALAVALSPDGARAAVAGCEGKIAIWDLAGAKQAFLLSGHEGPVAALAFSRERLWSAGWDGTVRAWKLNGKSGKQTGKWTLGGRELSALAVTPLGLAEDEERVLVASCDGGLAWLEPGAKKISPRPLPGREHAEWVRAAAFSPRGKRAVAVASAESLLLLLDPQRGQVAALEQQRAPSAAAFTPDGAALLIGRFDGSLERLPLPAEGRDTP